MRRNEPGADFLISRMTTPLKNVSTETDLVWSVISFKLSSQLENKNGRIRDDLYNWAWLLNLLFFFKFRTLFRWKPVRYLSVNIDKKYDRLLWRFSCSQICLFVKIKLITIWNLHCSDDSFDSKQNKVLSNRSHISQSFKWCVYYELWLHRKRTLWKLRLWSFLHWSQFAVIIQLGFWFCCIEIFLQL